MASVDLAYSLPMKQPKETKKGEVQRVYHLDGGKAVQFTSSRRKLLQFKADIRFKDGKQRFYHCSSRSIVKARKEASQFVESIMNETGEQVYWRIDGFEDQFRLGPHFEEQSLKQRIKRFGNWFFDLED